MSDIDYSLKRVDAHFRSIEKTIEQIKVSLAEVREDLKHLPGKGFIFSVCLGLLAAIGGMTTLIVRFLSP